MRSIETSLGIANGLREEKKFDQALEVLFEARELLPNSEPGVAAYIEAASTLLERNNDLGDVVRAEVMLLDAAEEAEAYASELQSQLKGDQSSDKAITERVNLFNKLGTQALSQRASALELLGRKSEAAAIRKRLSGAGE